MGVRDRSYALNRGIQKMSTAAQVLRICESRLNEFSVVNAATALDQIAKSPDSQDPSFENGLDKLILRLQELLCTCDNVQPRTLATVCLSVTRLDIVQNDLFINNVYEIFDSTNLMFKDRHINNK